MSHISFNQIFTFCTLLLGALNSFCGKMKIFTSLCIFLHIGTICGAYFATAQVCTDNSQYRIQCLLWKRAGYCLPTSSWQRFMRRNCIKTCGLCTTKVVIPATNQGSCFDNTFRAKYCPQWRASGFCSKSSTYHGFMKSNCAKTCGFCGKATTAPPTTQPPTTKPKVVKVTCQNTPKYTQNCQQWRNNGFCARKSRWFGFMQDHCKVTCGFCSAPTKTNDCGLVGGRVGRVIGGVDAPANYWKWQAALQDTGAFFCGGSLIHPRWILTAAHCTYYKTDFLDSITVVLGEHNRQKNVGNEVTIGVEKIINHPQYLRSTLVNDIALVKLSSDAPLNDVIGLVCLPKRGVNVAVNKMCYITGWGKMEHPGRSVPILQQAKLPIVSTDACLKQNSRTGPQITKKMVCAGYGPKSVISGCHGDSGGPLVCENDNFRYILEGAVSWGSTKCDTKDKYTVFTRISEYIDWIENTMKNN